MAAKIKSNPKDELVAAYLSALDLTVIFLATATENPKFVSFEMMPWPATRTVEGTELIEVFTFAKSGHAQLVMDICSVAAEAIAGIEGARSAFDEAVALVGATWRSYSDLVGGALADIDELEQHLKAWNASGGLSRFNAAYKRYRELCAGTALPCISYSAYLHEYKLKMANLVGANVAAGQAKFDGLASLRPDPTPEIKRRDHFRSGRQEKLNDLPQTGRSYVMPGWTHPNQFPRRQPRT